MAEVVFKKVRSKINQYTFWAEFPLKERTAKFCILLPFCNYLLMKLKLTFIALFTSLAFTGFAQQNEKASLETSMAPATTAFSVSDSAVIKATEVKTVAQMPKKVSFSLTAGTMFSNYGYASYLAPSMYYRLNNKFSVFSSVTYLNNNFTPFASENRQPMATKHYLAQSYFRYRFGKLPNRTNWLSLRWRVAPTAFRSG